ncbi:MAG TPA: hypothetical protein VMN04_13000 [Thermoanaerobaculia bacterium]|nr:hypothetical protein [Thermoanaerobaculia bacterium]
MRRSFIPAAAIALVLAGTAAAGGPGGPRASASARVSVSIPALHGADVPETRRGVALVALRGGAARLELPALRVMSTNSDASLSVTRRVSGGANARVSRGGREDESVARAARAGATGWTELSGDVDVPSLAKASMSNSARPITIVYEVWSF